MKQTSLFTLILVISALLSACGGSTGSAATVATPTKWTGTKQLGVTGANTVANGIAVDSNGNVYVAGSTNGNLDSQSLKGTQDLFLTKYSSLGIKVRTMMLGMTGGTTTTANGIAIDASGNVYVVGTTNGSLPPNTIAGIQDYFLSKYDTTGVLQFTKQLGVNGSISVATSVALDLSGNIYVAGYTTGSLPPNIISGPGAQDFFLSQYDSTTGSLLYTKQLGISGVNTAANSVAVDISGNVYVAGYTYGALDGQAKVGFQDLFLTKYGSSGTKLGTTQMGVAGVSTVATSLSVDSASNVYMTGYTYGALPGGTALIGAPDYFLIKNGPTGTNLFTTQLGVASTITEANGVAVDLNGNIYVGGYTYGALDSISRTGNQDLFLTRYSSAGTKVRTKLLGVSLRYTSANSIAIDLNGNVYVAGFTTGGLDGNTVMGNKDLFITKYDSLGVKQ